MAEREPKRYIVNIEALPDKFPTHKHDADFWESLGRAVATFGFLEEILGKAIFALTATRRYKDEVEAQQAYVQWLPTLERALIDPLGKLIEAFGKATHDNPDAKIDNLDALLIDLRKASAMRNILCHGSWRPPDANEASLPFFVNRQKMVVDSPMDCAFLNQVQQHTAELACAVINTVTHMGFQFPGSKGPGIAIW